MSDDEGDARRHRRTEGADASRGDGQGIRDRAVGRASDRDRLARRDGGGDRPVRDRDSDRPVRDRGGDRRVRDRSSGSIDSSHAGGSVGRTGESAAAVAREVTVDTGTIEATLVGIPLMDLQEVAFEHRIDRERLESEETDQPVALFDLHNTSGVPIQWTASRTRFIGDDGYTYSPAQLSLDPSALGPGIHTRRVEIQPDRRARVATLVERLPAGVDIVEVVQTLPIRAGGADTEQLVFTIAE